MARVELYFRALDPAEDEAAFKQAAAWWRKPHTRKRATFRAGWQDTYGRLQVELERAGVTEAALEIVTSRQSIRNDGWLRGSAVIREPAVTLWVLQGKHGPQRFACDRFTDWRANVRAIAMSLEALRLVDRFGVTEHGEQYRGFAALPGPGDGQRFRNADEAHAWLAAQSGLPPGPRLWTDHFRAAAKRFHPDMPTGDVALFKRVTAAKELIEAAGG